MPQQVREPDVVDNIESGLRDSAIALTAIEKPYAKPMVATFALDSDSMDSGDALTANG
jgi:hypothetical protein